MSLYDYVIKKVSLSRSLFMRINFLQYMLYMPLTYISRTLKSLDAALLQCAYIDHCSYICIRVHIGICKQIEAYLSLSLSLTQKYTHKHTGAIVVG